MNKRRVFGGIAAVVVLLGVGVWYFVLRSDAPPPLSLDEAVRSIEGPDAGDAVPTTASATATPSPGGPGLDGMWTLDTANSVVGYRVREELARIGFTEAVGRTSDIDGSLALSGSTVTAVDVMVDMSTLQSDSDQRDGQMRTQGLETNDFPTATFALSEAIDLGAVPTDGVPLMATATGDLTIHGVTQRVSIPIEAQLVGDTIAILGSIEVLFADYGIDPPSSFAVLSVEDRGQLEMQLAFTLT